MDLYQQQARNRQATWALFAGFALLFAAMGLAVDFYMPLHLPLTLGNASLPLPILPFGAAAFSALSSAYSYYQGDKIVLGAMRAKPIDPDNLKHRQLHNVVEEMALASGLPMPKLYLLPDDDLNAFATGRSPEFASLAVTEGLLESLDREELQAVVAHEMGHIRNLDIRTMMIVSVLLGAIALMGDLVVNMNRGSSRSRSKGASVPLPLILIGLLAPLIARMVAMAVSRTREFEADRSAAEFTRNPLALARALDKLEAAQAPTKYASQGTAHLFIVDPRVSKLNEREDWMGNLFATHPPIKARIERLKAMGYERPSAKIP